MARGVSVGGIVTIETARITKCRSSREIGSSMKIAKVQSVSGNSPNRGKPFESDNPLLLTLQSKRAKLISCCPDSL